MQVMDRLLLFLYLFHGATAMTCASKAGTSISGQTISTVMVNGVQQCCDSCASTQGCVASVLGPGPYPGEDYFKCELKSVVSPSSAAPNHTLITRGPAPAPTPPAPPAPVPPAPTPPAPPTPGPSPPAPAGGKTYLMIGQNWENEFKDYVDKVSGDNRPAPAGISIYTEELVKNKKIGWMGGSSYNPPTGTAKDFLDNWYNKASANGGQIFVESTLAFKFPGSATIPTLEGIAQGDYDVALEDYATVMKAKLSATFLIRVGYEVSCGLFGCGQSSYANAFKYIKKFWSDVKNVKLVFHPISVADAQGLYPGDGVADVVGVSMFNPQQLQESNNILAWAQTSHPSMELMISESSAQTTGGCNVPNMIEAISSSTEKYDVRYWVWINQNWPAIDMWSHGGWCDTRVQSVPGAMDAWSSTVLKKGSRFMCQGEPCAHSKHEIVAI